MVDRESNEEAEVKIQAVVKSKSVADRRGEGVNRKPT